MNNKIRDTGLDYHSKKVIEVLNELKTTNQGLSTTEAVRRLETYGPNEIPEKKRKHPIILFLEQFKSALIGILLIAAVISYITDHLIDVYVIIVVVMVNAVMGFVQEVKAEKSIQALKKMVLPIAKVYRDNSLIKIKANELVPGDVILLEEGDRIPADARLIELKDLETLEASLTGESTPVSKKLIELPKATGVSDRLNMAWMGTFIARGTAKAVIIGTGKETIIGNIATDIDKIGNVKEHFQIKTDTLAKQMATIAIIGASLIFIIGYFYDNIEFTEVLLFSISTLVSGIPEGLPAVLVIVLSIGAHRMAKRKAIMRKLASTETLGVVDTIVTDKTGTLTMNTMNIERAVIIEEEDYEITGNGWEPKGVFKQKNQEIIPLENKALDKLIHICALCNNAKVLKKEDNNYEAIGDPTEAALVVLAEKAGIKKEVLLETETIIDDLPFNSENQYRATLIKMGNKKQAYLVGAPEKIINQSTSYLTKEGLKKLTPTVKKELIKRMESLTDDAMRILGIAYKEVRTKSKTINELSMNNLVLAGIVGMRDPLRPEVPEAVLKAKKAGIRIIMSTGDHKRTAIAVAINAGIISKGEEAVTEDEISKLSNNEFKELVKKVNIYARLTPSTKLRLAEELQNQGHLIAMTGDGVNDAPALKKADIGIAMGIMGTEVSKEVSEMVLADDNFATIINAIEEGRIVFENTRRTSYYLITTNFAEHVTILTTLILTMPLPLIPTQILWLNLVTDGVNDVALATEPGHDEVLDEKPKSIKENILSKNILPYLLIISLVMGSLTIGFFTMYLPQGIDKARTIAFSVMTFSQLWRVLNMRSLRKSIFTIGFFTNKYINASISASIIMYLTAIYNPVLQTAFKFVALEWWEIIEIVLLTSIVLWAGEIYQYYSKKRMRKSLG